MKVPGITFAGLILVTPVYADHSTSTVPDTPYTTFKDRHGTDDYKRNPAYRHSKDARYPVTPYLERRDQENRIQQSPIVDK
jgi:hypothetical protein